MYFRFFLVRTSAITSTVMYLLPVKKINRVDDKSVRQCPQKIHKNHSIVVTELHPAD